MFTPMENEYFEQLLDSRFENVKDQHAHINDKLNAILVQTTKTNGRVSDLEKEIQGLHQWRATSQGHWKGVILVCTILGFMIGIISVYLWH